MPRVAALLAAAGILLTATGPAAAGPPGKWTQLGEANLTSIDEVALARTADGTLHAVWRIPGVNADSLVHDAIGPTGAVAPPNVITSEWATIDTVPDVLATPDGLRVFFGGIRSTNPDEPNSNMNTATAPPSGALWSLFPGTIVTGDAAYGSDSGAALLPDGTPLLSFGGTGTGVFVHRGLDAGTPNFPLQTQLGGCCGYSPDIAVDTANGEPFVVWYSSADGHLGVFAQSLNAASGQPTGSPTKMPGSSTIFNGRDSSSQQLSRTPIAARAGGGVYVVYPGGYPTTEKVRLWRIAGSRSAVVGNSDASRIASLAADPDGRLWVFWSEQTSPPRIFARRSNRSATKFGPAVRLAPPKGWTSAYRISGDAQSRRLDLVVLLGTTSNQAQWHTQVLPALSLTASPSMVRGGKSTAVRFTVRDPDPVKGAKVKAGGRSATTAKNGRATIKLGPTKARSLKATAKKVGYRVAVKRIRVKR